MWNRSNGRRAGSSRLGRSSRLERVPDRQRQWDGYRGISRDDVSIRVVLDADFGVDAPIPAPERSDPHEVLKRKAGAGIPPVNDGSRNVARSRQRIVDVPIGRPGSEQEEPQKRINREGAE